MKKCSKCNIEKPLSNFAKDKQKKDGLCYWCKECKKEVYNSKRLEILKQKKSYYKENKEEIRERSKKSYHKNAEKNRFYSREYYKNNKEERLKYWRRYREENKEKTNASSLRYIKNRLATDEVYAFKVKVTNLIRASVNRRGIVKSKRTEEILGCTILEFKNYIENLFTEGMSWDNYGEWHYDHIIPISEATNEKEILFLNRFENFQPLWGCDNRKKSNNFDEKNWRERIQKD